MKISLNKANKLRNQLEGLNFEIPHTVNMRVDLDSEAFRTAFNEEFQVACDAISKVCKKIAMEFELRTLIQKANADNNINELIGKIAKTERLIKSMSEIYNLQVQVQKYPSLDEAWATIDAKKKHQEKNPEAAPISGRTLVALWDKSIPEKTKETLATLKLESQELQEKRNELNHKVVIELPKEMVEFLREHNLIK